LNQASGQYFLGNQSPKIRVRKVGFGGSHASGPRRQQKEYIMAQVDYEQMLGELLARIHRDGGHYTAAHGYMKSFIDADIKVANLNVLYDQSMEKENGPARGGTT
jgi:hypothetical protein